MTAPDKRPVALVGCVKTKRATPSVARDLYTSPWFRGARTYAERHAEAWYILSAEHGVLSPDIVVHPYERTLSRMSKRDRSSWAARVQQQLLDLLPPQARVLLLAGQCYRDGVEDFLRAHGHSVDVPMKRLRSGEQLQWLARENRRDDAH